MSKSINDLLNFDYGTSEFIFLDKFKNIDNVPVKHKYAALAVSPFLIFALFWFLFVVPLDEDIEVNIKKVEQQQSQYNKNKKIANDIERKRVEYAKLKDDLSIALNMLPKKSQIPDLLDNVSKAGLDAGLKFSKFQPVSEVGKSIYTEVPSNFVAQANFYQLMDFLDYTGKMPRIVDVKGLKIERIEGDTDLLNVKGNILTYRFTESAQAKPEENKK